MKIRALIIAGAFMALAGSASAQTYSLSSFVIGSGATPMSGGGYSLNGTIGQAVIGPVSQGPWVANQGFWYTITPQGLGGVKEVPGQANSYELAQNYPNPFNPSTTIRFSVPERTKVTLRVMNLLGEEVRRVIDQEVYEPGTWEVDFQAQDLPSGTYVYRLEAGNTVKTRKMVLMK